METCRVYLFTYKRNELLKRAIKSLINQTYTNWTCELHNDAPDDPFPAYYLNILNDKRFILKNHAVNLGPTKSFNLAFTGCDEKYASLLEDDNWWEANFLKETIETLESNPEIPICWANMQIWTEHQNNEWVKEDKTIWKTRDNLFFKWPNIKQPIGAVHSNGAMLWRSVNANKYQIPENALFNAVELIRERTFDYPLYLIGKPLANYSFTLQTNQSKKDWEWTGTQVMMLESFISSCSESKMVEEIYDYYAQSSHLNLLIIALSKYNDRLPIKLRFKNLLLKSKYFMASPYRYFKLKKFLSDQKEVAHFLNIHTKALGSITKFEPVQVSN